MIVPRFRMLMYAALFVALPVSFIPVFAEYRIPLVVFLSVSLLIPIIDAALAGRSVRGIVPKAGSVIRLTKNMNLDAELAISNESRAAKRIRIGIHLPPQVASDDMMVRATLPEGGGGFRITYPLTGLKRGRYISKAYYIEGTSSLGFFHFRKRIPVETEIRVYPNLREERKKAAAIFLQRNRIGAKPRRMLGRGREFEQLREYLPGDAYTDIHWKTTAKRREPVTKMFQVEHAQEIYVALDASRLSLRMIESFSGEKRDDDVFPPTVFDRYLQAAFMLFHAAESQGDRFGVIAADATVREFVPAKNGKSHYTLCRDRLYSLTPAAAAPDYEELFSFIRTRVPRRALFVFLTSLDDPLIAEQFTEHLHIIGRKHLVLAAVVKPFRARPFFQNPKTESVDDVYDDLSGHLMWQKLRSMEHSLRFRGATFLQMENEHLIPGLISEYLSIKQRQAL